MNGERKAGTQVLTLYVGRFSGPADGNHYKGVDDTGPKDLLHQCYICVSLSSSFLSPHFHLRASRACALPFLFLSKVVVVVVQQSELCLLKDDWIVSSEGNKRMNGRMEGKKILKTMNSVWHSLPKKKRDYIHISVCIHPLLRSNSVTKRKHSLLAEEIWPRR